MISVFIRESAVFRPPQVTYSVIAIPTLSFRETIESFPLPTNAALHFAPLCPSAVMAENPFALRILHYTCGNTIAQVVQLLLREIGD